VYFNTLEYLGFFVLVWIGVHAARYRMHILLVASVVFYVVAGWFDTALITGVVVGNWLLLRVIRHGRARIVAAVVVNIGVLVAVKYRVFLLGDQALFATAYSDVVLPLGISFYTFQLLAYQVDAARDPSLEERRAGVFALFIMFFPQLIAGPIVRARELLPQLRALAAGQRRRLRFVSYGLALCALGLTKKIVFADSLAPFVDDIFSAGPTNAPQAWTGAWLFTFQIYFDFSGYSDIAIGSAYLLGIRLPRNFRTPYLSTSPREFWQRWHITLSTWIRDYLYIPLGGGRGSGYRQAAVLLSVMGVAGLWHGANLTFVVWGLLWGLYIGLHRAAVFCISGSPRMSRALDTVIVRALLYAAHISIVVCLWVCFRAESMDAAYRYLAVMFSVPERFTPDAAAVLAGCAGLLLLHRVEALRLTSHSIHALRRWNVPFVWGLFGGICLWLVVLPSYTQNPFIYFRF
jgi:alginate O-acetyltransferase complex protein AlgI